jgi:hypothetical protein
MNQSMKTFPPTVVGMRSVEIADGVSWRLPRAAEVYPFEHGGGAWVYLRDEVHIFLVIDGAVREASLLGWLSDQVSGGLSLVT